MNRLGAQLTFSADERMLLGNPILLIRFGMRDLCQRCFKFHPTGALSTLANILFRCRG